MLQRPLVAVFLALELLACATTGPARQPGDLPPLGFGLTLPEGWTLDKQTADRVAYRKGEVGLGVNVASNTPALESLAAILTDKGPEDGWRNIQTSTDLTLAGQPALRVSFEADGPQGPDRTLMAIVNAAGRNYTLMFRAPPEAWDEAGFLAIARTFRVVAPPTPDEG